MHIRWPALLLLPVGMCISSNKLALYSRPDTFLAYGRQGRPVHRLSLMYSAVGNFCIVMKV